MLTQGKLISPHCLPKSLQKCQFGFFIWSHWDKVIFENLRIFNYFFPLWPSFSGDLIWDKSHYWNKVPSKIGARFPMGPKINLLWAVIDTFYFGHIFILFMAAVFFAIGKMGLTWKIDTLPSRNCWVLSCSTLISSSGKSDLYLIRSCASFFQAIDYTSTRGGVSVLTNKAETTVSSLIIQKAAVQDGGVYSCQAGQIEPSSVKIHVLTGNTIDLSFARTCL